MKVMRSTFFAAMLASTAALAAVTPANAELISNVPLDQSRFELMSLSDLTAHAQQGNKYAQFYLGKRLQKGLSVKKDPQKAILWYTKAANQGATPAQLNLGRMYSFGKDVAVDEKKARFWLQKAALAGDNRASYILALIDEKQEKLVDAYKWYDLSARDGMLNDTIRSKARNKIGQLALNLSTSDISRARYQADRLLHVK